MSAQKQLIINYYIVLLFMSDTKTIAWAIPEGELIEANKKLSSGGSYVVQALSPQELKRMVMDVYTHPSKHVEVIRQIINIYGLENSKEGQGSKKVW
jgi:hypothetical protein